MCFDVGFVTCGPNEAMVISGVFHEPPTIIRGGRALVFPGFQIIQRLPLTTMTIKVETPLVYTQQGVPLTVKGVAQVKFNSKNMENLAAAISQFGNMSIDEISHGMLFHSCCDFVLYNIVRTKFMTRQIMYNFRKHKLSSIL